MCKTLLFPHGFSFHSLIHASSFGKLYTNFTNFHCFPYLISNLLAVDGLPNFPMPRPHEDGRFERLARHLRKGHLVAFPTETVRVAPSDNVIVNIVIPKINVELKNHQGRLRNGWPWRAASRRFLESALTFSMFE